MNSKTKWIVLLTSLTVLLVLAAVTAYAGSPGQDSQPSDAGDAQAAPSAPVGTAFTYQGKLEGSSGPISATCTIAFRLYDQAASGAQVGSPLTRTISIDNGLFTESLDFGASAFNGQARWLGILVKCPGDTAFTDMGRQALTAAPYALYALKAPWSGLTGVPAGFADGVDNNTTYSAGTGLSLAGTTFSANTTYLQRRVTGTCAAGNAIRVIAADGTVTCQAVPGTHDHWGETWTGSDTGLTLEGGDFGVSSSGSIAGVYGDGTSFGVYGFSFDGDGVYGSSSAANGAGVMAVHSSSTGTALSIQQGAFQVAGAGEDTDTPVFIHKVETGASGNICAIQNYATVIDHPLLNGKPGAILIITPNYGPASAGALVRQPYGVYYDDTNQCGFGAGRWVIYGYGVSPASPLALVNDQSFNVMVVLP